jgi:hypothetical protein
VQGNRLATLTPTMCNLVELEVLYVGRNPLSDLPDLTGCVALTTLWMAECQFISLPLSIADVPSLTNFYCEGNPLKFPDPAFYDRGGNDEVLKHLRQVSENKNEQAEIARIRKEKAEVKGAKAAAKAMARMEREKRGGESGGGADGTTDDEGGESRGGGLRASVASSVASRYATDRRGSVGRRSVASSDGGGGGSREGGGFLSGWRGSVVSGSRAGFRRNSLSGGSTDDDDDRVGGVRGGGRRRRGSRTSAGSSDAEDKGPSMGKLLWRRVRRVVIEEKKVREAADQSGNMNFDMLLRARELTTGIKLVNAQDDLAVFEEELEAAKRGVYDADAYLRGGVDEISATKEKMRKQRDLMKEYKSITDDYLKQLQLSLRDEKKTLRKAMEGKEAADEVGRCTS